MRISLSAHLRRLARLTLGAAIWFLDRIDRGARAKAKPSELTPSPIRA